MHFQSDTEITEHADVAMYVMTPEYGAATQLEKIDMLDYADIVALNKFDRRGALEEAQRRERCVVGGDLVQILFIRI